MTNPSFKARNQSREMLQFGAYTSQNRVQDVDLAPMPGLLGEVHLGRFD